MRVSVALLTYNHERYIAQAIESVLAQRGVELELNISEDCSTDGTRAIVDEYAARHPDIVRVVSAPHNVGMTRAFARGVEAATGRYVAILDGDDYWTSPDKLRIQADYLDAHPELAICFHNVTVVHEDGGVAPHPFHSPVPQPYPSRVMPKMVSTLADVAPGNFMSTCSVMFRRGLFGAFPEWFTDLAVADWPLHVLNAEHGDIGYLDADMAVYRVHDAGAWTASLSRYRRRDAIERFAEVHRILDRHLRGRFATELETRVRALYLEGVQTCYAEHRLGDALYYARAYLAQLSWRERLRPRALLESLARARRSRAQRSRAARTGS